MKFDIDALCAGHAGLQAGRTDRTAKLCAEEPVEDRDQHEDEDGNDKDRIFIKCNAFNITKRDEQIVLADVDRLICLSHDLQIYRIEGKLCQDSGEDRRDTP